MRNPSKNTIKRLMRPGNAGHAINVPGHALQVGDYFMFNEVGAALYRMSKGSICNREPKGWLKYVPPHQRWKELLFCHRYYKKH